MKFFLRFAFLFIILIGFMDTSAAYSQKKSKSIRQIERRSKKADGLLQNDKSRKVLRAERKAANAKEKEAQAYERAKKKDLKHRMDLQSKKTKEMMKETQKKSDQARKDKREPFFKRLFRKKPR